MNRKDKHKKIKKNRYMIIYKSSFNSVYISENQTVLVIVHNIAFCTQSRVRISQHSRIISMLKKALAVGEHTDSHRLAAATCWALMSSSQKTKGEKNKLKHLFKNNF